VVITASFTNSTRNWGAFIFITSETAVTSTSKTERKDFFGLWDNRIARIRFASIDFHDPGGPIIKKMLVPFEAKRSDLLKESRKWKIPARRIK